MPVVAAAVRHDVQHAARGASVLGAVPGRLDLHLLDEISRQVLARRAEPGVGRLHPVDHHAVLGAGRSVDGDTACLPLVVGAGRVGRDRREVATAGQPLEHLAREARRTRGLGDGEARRAGHDVDPLGNAGRPKRQVNRQLCPEHERDIDDPGRVEPVESRNHLVPAGRQRGISIPAGRVRHDLQRQAVLVRDRHRRARQNAALHVADDALDGTRLLLACSRCRCEKAAGDGGRNESLHCPSLLSS